MAGNPKNIVVMHGKFVAVVTVALVLTGRGLHASDLSGLGLEDNPPKQSKPAVPESGARAHYDLGLQLQKDKQYREAVEAFAQAIKEKADFTDAYVQWGITLQQMSHQTVSPADKYNLLKNAAEKFDRAARLKSGDKEILTQWAATLGMISDLPLDRDIRYPCALGAAEKYRMACDAAPDDWQVFMNWGMALFLRLPGFAADQPARSLAYKRAAEVFGKAVDHAVGTREIVDSHVMWGRALSQAALTAWDPGEKLGLLREAVDKYDRASHTDSKAANIYALWGVSLIELGRVSRIRSDYRSAVEKFGLALEFKPDDADTLYNMACAYMLLGETNDALENLSKCFNLDTSNTYRKSAREDRDLIGLRGDRRFEDMLKGYKPGVPSTAPRVRDGSR